VTRPEAIIFDMDGLLLNTEVLANQAWQQTSVDVLGFEIPEYLIVNMIGMNELDCYRYMSQQLDIEIPESKFSNAFGEHYSKILEKGIDLKNGCFELLDFLEENSIPKVVATSTKTELAIHKLEISGLVKRFLYVIGGDQVEFGKPSPDIYLLAAQKLAMNPQNCLALEDSENGVRSASSANINVICVPDLKPPSDELISLTYKVLPSLHEVKEYLETY